MPAGEQPDPLLGLAPDKVCTATPVTWRPVGSCPTISPLPAAEVAGGVFSVALSVPVATASRRAPGVTRCRALRSPDFPRACYARGGLVRLLPYRLIVVVFVLLLVLVLLVFVLVFILVFFQVVFEFFVL
jgi:hypothetical protein